MSDPVNPEYINAPWANQVDGLTDAVMVVDYPHHEIHSDSAFYCERYVAALGAGATIELVIVTPAGTKEAHMTFGFGAPDGPAVFEVWRNAETAADGTTVGIRGRKQAGTNTSILTITHTPTTPDVSGSVVEKLFTRLSGSSGQGNQSGTGGSGETRDEWVLAPSTKYLVRLTNNDSGEARCLSYLSWYEHAQTAQVYTTKWNRSTRRRAT